MSNRWVRQGTLAVLCSIAGWGCFSVLDHTLQQKTQAAPTEIIVPAQVRPLPGQLDRTRLFNSNSPEWVKTEGILLSTFPPQGQKTPAAHLNIPLEGSFHLFAHHFVHTPKDLQTLYLGILVHNSGDRPVTLQIPQAASYRLEPDAPFQSKPAILENPTGDIFSGPGIRAVDTVLRGQRQRDIPAQITLPPKQSRMILNHPIPVKGLSRPVNGRSTFMKLRSRGKVYMASLALFARKNPNGSDRAPSTAEWQQVIEQGGLAGAREKTPTPPDQKRGSLIYGRVAGIQQGAIWQATLTDPGSQILALPPAETPIAYPVATLRGGRLGTSQSQTAPLLARYADTAYEAHGNYATLYDLTIPLKNTTPTPQTTTLTVSTPIKEDKLSKNGLRYRNPPLDFPFFRGTIRLRYPDEQGKSQTRYIHLWHRMGQQVPPLATLKMAPGEHRTVKVEFFYPPDATPPQVLSIGTAPAPES